jgi:hypothetical protein
LTFEPGPAVLVREYGTERKAAWWVLAHGDEGPLGGLGPEPDSPEFARLVRESTGRRQVHALLRDQRVVAGIGRGYADDILHRARLSPLTWTSRLTDAEADRLFEAARAEGRREPPEAYAADALVEAVTGNGTQRGRSKVVVRLDLQALLRGARFSLIWPRSRRIESTWFSGPSGSAGLRKFPRRFGSRPSELGQSIIPGGQSIRLDGSWQRPTGRSRDERN